MSEMSRKIEMTATGCYRVCQALYPALMREASVILAALAPGERESVADLLAGAVDYLVQQELILVEVAPKKRGRKTDWDRLDVRIVYQMLASSCRICGREFAKGDRYRGYPRNYAHEECVRGPLPRVEAIEEFQVSLCRPEEGGGAYGR